MNKQDKIKKIVEVLCGYSVEDTLYNQLPNIKINELNQKEKKYLYKIAKEILKAIEVSQIKLNEQKGKAHI